MYYLDVTAGPCAKVPIPNRNKQWTDINFTYIPTVLFFYMCYLLTVPDLAFSSPALVEAIRSAQKKAGWD
jgi:hypothetical protein